MVNQNSDDTANLSIGIDIAGLERSGWGIHAEALAGMADY